MADIAATETPEFGRLTPEHHQWIDKRRQDAVNLLSCRALYPLAQSLPREDAEGEAMLALCDAAARWEEKRGKWTTIFVILCRDRLQRAAAAHRGVGRHGFRCGRGDAGLSHKYDAPAPDAGPCELELAEDAAVFAGLLGRLPDLERSVLVGHFRDGRPYTDIAAEVGCSKQWIHKLGTRALARCRKLAGVS